MRLLLIGAPGAGKGTQAELLAKRFGIAHISSGDLLRQHVKDGTSLGQRIKSYVDRGDLVPDGLVIGPAQMPWVAVSVTARCAVPVMAGEPVNTGGAPATTAVGALATASTPSAFTPVAFSRNCVCSSAPPRV